MNFVESSAYKAAINSGLGEQLNSGAKKIVEVKSRFFIFECLVRDDKTVVLHLRHLTPAFRRTRELNFLAKWFRDRVGGFDSYYADFIGTVAKGDMNQRAARIDSMDIFIRGYKPALMYDENFIHRHFSDLATKLIEELNCKY